jgi:hypothetical protein
MASMIESGDMGNGAGLRAFLLGVGLLFLPVFFTLEVYPPFTFSLRGTGGVPSPTGELVIACNK